MAFVPKNYVDGVGPDVAAAWLNQLDQLANNALQSAVTVPALQAILGIPSFTSPLPVTEGGTGANSVGGAQVALGINQSYIGAQLFPKTLAEANESIVPTNLWKPPGNVLRYGTNTTPGTTDMTAAIQAALTQARQATGVSAYLPAGTYFVSGQLFIYNNSQFYGDGSSSIITTAFATNDLIVAQDVANVNIRWIKVVHTATVTGGYVGTIVLRGTNNSTVEGCEISGGYFIGIYVSGSAANAAVHNRIIGNYLHSATNTIQDSSDIKLDSTATFGASYNVVDSNQCFGGGNWMGISLEASSNPNIGILRNVVTNNRVGAHTCYGIILYTHTAGDTYNQVIGNYIEGITGTSLTGAGGTGIYVASMSAVTVANNTVANCCNASSSQFNQGGITILSGFVGSPNVVTGNAVYDMCQGNTNALTVAGINIISTPPGTVVTGNQVSQQTGFTSIGYNGIYVQGGNGGVTITGNNVSIINTIPGTRGIFALANGANLSNLTINGNTVLGCSSRGISLEQVSGFTVNNYSITGNTVSGGAATSIPLNITTAGTGSVSGNTGVATTTTAMTISSVTNTVFTGNVLTSSGATTVASAGTCAGSVFDSSNLINGGLSNLAAGLHCEQKTGVSPGALTFASVLGDIATSTAGTVPSGWICTATGTPGAWVPLPTSPSVVTGFGTPTGNAVVSAFPGASATLLQTSETVAELLVILKAAGMIGT